MSTPKRQPPDFTVAYTEDKDVASVPKTNAVGKSAHFEDILKLRKEWCELDTQWWDAKEGSAERKELETQIKEIEKELEKLQSETYTTGRLKQTCNLPKPSALFEKTMGGLKTRRRKHRNGSTRIQRHRASRVSRRKRQTRRA